MTGGVPPHPVLPYKTRITVRDLEYLFGFAASNQAHTNNPLVYGCLLLSFV